MSALSRKARARAKRDLHPPAASPPQEENSEPPEPFVNHGLARWNEQRLAWTAKRPDVDLKRTPPPPPEDRLTDEQDLYTALLTPNYQPLPRRVPLGELIDMLQEIRELGD